MRLEAMRGERFLGALEDELAVRGHVVGDHVDLGLRAGLVDRDAELDRALAQLAAPALVDQASAAAIYRDARVEDLRFRVARLDRRTGGIRRWGRRRGW